MHPIYKLPYLIDRLSLSKGILADDGFLEIKTDTTEREQINAFFNRTQLKLKDTPGVQQRVCEINSSEIANFIAGIDKKSNYAISKCVPGYNIDIVYEHLSEFGDSVHRDSQLWHHDSVGTRIKIFLSKSLMNVAPTEIEIGRRGGSFRQPAWTKQERINYKPMNRVVQSATTIDTVSVFDTNFVHRGLNGPKGTSRHLIMIELSHPLKRFCRGKIGPRNFL